MTGGVLSQQRRRSTVSLSVPAADEGPVEQLDHAIEIIHRITQSLPETVLDREELIALGGLLTQVGGALVTLADLLIAPTHHYDRIRTPHEGSAIVTPRALPEQRQPAATVLLLSCRNSYLAASTAARAFHAALKLSAPPADSGRDAGTGQGDAVGLVDARHPTDERHHHHDGPGLPRSTPAGTVVRTYRRPG